MAKKLHGILLLILYGIITVSGLILLIVAFMQLFSDKGIKRKKTKAVISHIGEIEETDEDGVIHLDYMVFVDYIIGNKKYHNVKVDAYKGSWKKADKIKIYYNKANHNDITTFCKAKAFFIFALIGIIALMAGGYGILQIIGK